VNAAVPSPCTSVCTLGRDDICTGCGRSLSEIAEWGAATPARQRAIALAAGLRLAATQPGRA
jgi:predicted Fe-S protein YdhL (DUF1289 family)